MSKNEYILLNGSPIELSLHVFKNMMEKDMLKIPVFKDIIRFNNHSRFFADMTCMHETDEFTSISVNYGNSFNILNDRDIYHEYYSLFLHKNYPLIVNSTVLLNSGRIDIVLTKADSRHDYPGLNGITRFDSNIPGTNTDTRNVQIIRPDEAPDYIKILSRKDHILGDITPLHRSKFSEAELKILLKMGFIDIAYCMFEAWDDVSDQEKTEAYSSLKEHENSGKDMYKNPTYANMAITGSFSIYELEIDCYNLKVDESNTVIFENIFIDNICLKRDFPKYLIDQSDYWVESDIMTDIVDEEFRISTSLLLTEIDPAKNGKAQVTVVNKLINDVRTDHGWHM